MLNSIRWLLSSCQQLQPRNEPSRPNSASSPSGTTMIEFFSPSQRKGLIAISSVASLSVLATFSVLCFLTYRFIFWRKYYRRYIGYNQYIVLVYNLTLADLLQSLGFTIALRWIDLGSLRQSDAACFVQGIWLQGGNVMSGMFVLAIAVYTFLHIMLDYQLSHRIFVASVVGLWIFGVLVVIIPIAILGRYAWIPSGAWCWLTIEHPALRLWTHYFWIFAAQFLTLLLHAIMFVRLQRRIADCIALGGRNTDSLRRLQRIVGYMVLYPVVYLSLTLPLAIGRMLSTSGHRPSITYFSVAGSLISITGVCDTILYILTRKNSILCPEESPTASNQSSRSSRRTWPGMKIFRKNKTLCPSLNTWDPISSVSTTTHRSDSTNGSTPYPEMDCRAVDQIDQETMIDMAYEPAHLTGSKRSSNDEWGTHWERNDSSPPERDFPRNEDV